MAQGIFGSTPLRPNNDTFSADPNRYLGDWTYGNFDWSKLTPAELQKIEQWAQGGWSPLSALGSGVGVPRQELHEGQVGTIYRLLGPERAAELGITPEMVQDSFNQNEALARWWAEQNSSLFDAEDLMGVLGVAGAAFGMNALGGTSMLGGSPSFAGAPKYATVADAIAAGDYAAADAMAANMFNTGNTLATGTITPGVGAISSSGVSGGASGIGGVLGDGVASTAANILNGVGGGAGGLLAAGIGALAGGAGGSKQDGVTTVTSEPWEKQQPYLLDAWNRAQGIMDSSNPITTQANENYQDLLGGPTSNPMLGLNNPYLASAIGSAQEDVIRGATSAFNNANRASGSFGNSGLQEAFARELPRQLGNISTSMRMQDYGNQQNLYENAVNRSTAATTNANDFAWRPLQNYNSIVGGGNWGGSQNTPYYTNPTSNILGGALTGYNIYNNLFGGK